MKTKRLDTDIVSISIYKQKYMTGKKYAYNTIIIYKHEDEVYVNKRNVKLWQ